MKRYHVIMGFLLGVIAILVVMTLKPVSEPSPVKKEDQVSLHQTTGVKRAVHVAPSSGRESSKNQVKFQNGVEREQAEPTVRSNPQESKTAAAQVKDVREQTVKDWEQLVDSLAKMTDEPTAELKIRVKEAFDKLDKEDQMSAIHQALNLFPDEQFPALYAILFDKAENAEVLDAIFSDALNRPEELKNPLMKELVKDKEHPCFFESARILDVIGELQVKPAPTASP